MNAENIPLAELKTLADKLVLLNKHMTFKTKTLDTLEGTMFGYDAKVILRTKLLNFVGDGPWSQVQLWVSCGGESLFTWGCVGLEDESMIRTWWWARREMMDEDAKLSRQDIRKQYLEAEKEILEQ